MSRGRKPVLVFVTIPRAIAASELVEKPLLLRGVGTCPLGVLPLVPSPSRPHPRGAGPGPSVSLADKRAWPWEGGTYGKWSPSGPSLGKEGNVPLRQVRGLRMGG